MSALSTKAKATTHRILSLYGQLVTLKHSEPGVYDPETGTVGTVVTSQTAVAVEQSYLQRDIDGTVVQQGDKKLLLTATNLSAPMVGDSCTVQGVIYAIKNVSCLSPDGTAILYELQLRK